MTRHTIRKIIQSAQGKINFLHMSTFRQLLPSGSMTCVDHERNCEVKAYPGGVYSALRTVDNGKKLGEIDKHIQRLLLSASEKFGSAFSSNVQLALTQNFLPFIRFIADNSPVSDADRRYTIVLDRIDGNPDCFQLLCSYNDIFPPPLFAAAEVQMLKRHNPQVKSVDWAIQREAAEKAKRESSNEVIIADNGRLYEGLSSNFAVIDRENRLITAPISDVLCGTIMELVKLAAQEINVPLVEDFPLVDDLPSCRAAFITSTSRLLLPINTIYLPDGKKIDFDYDPSDESTLLFVLRNLVSSKIIERAENIK